MSALVWRRGALLQLREGSLQEVMPHLSTAGQADGDFFPARGLRSVSCRLGALRGNVMGWGHGQTQVSQKTSSWLQSPVSMMRSFGVGAGESVFLVLRHLEGEYRVGKMAVTSPREESLAEKCCLLGRKAMNYFTNCNSLEMLVNNLYPG